jgi:predicted RNA-binding Zn ribbon-like protein
MDFACLDFVNSEQWDGFGRRTDHLQDSAWLEQFLARWDLTQVLGPEPLEWDQLVELRVLLRRIIEAIGRTGQPANEDMAAFNEVLKMVPVYRQLVRQDDTYQVSLRPLSANNTALLAEIAASAAELLARHNWRRVKVCHNDGCRWAFYDETRGNNRRWCNDLTCGNRDKVRRFRARQKKAGANS